MDFLTLPISTIAFCLAIVAIIFFLLKWVLKKLVPKFKYGTAVAAILSIAAAPCVWLVFLVCYMAYQDHIPQRKFNSNEWMSDNVDVRKHMKDDIVKSKILEGKNRQDVYRLLGAPTGSADTASQWYYNMGMADAGFGWSFHSLYLRFLDGKVVEVHVSETLE